MVVPILVIFITCVCLMLFGIVMRSLTPGVSQSYGKDFSEALAMLCAFAFIFAIALMNGSYESVLSDAMPNAFGKTVEKIIPFFKCITDSNDAFSLMTDDLGYFVEELIHLIFMTVGFNILKELLPTTARGDTWMGDVFIWMTSQFILLAILAMVYQHIENNGIIHSIVSVIVPALTVSLPLPALFIAILGGKKGTTKLSVGIALALLCAFFKEIAAVIAYLVVISYIATRMPEITEAVSYIVALVIAAGPVIIVAVGIFIVLRSVIFTK